VADLPTKLRSFPMTAPQLRIALRAACERLWQVRVQRWAGAPADEQLARSNGHRLKRAA